MTAQNIIAENSTRPLKGLGTLYRLGGIAAWLQLASLVAYGIVQVVLGAKPETVEGFYQIYERSPLEMALRGDLLLLVMIAWYLFTFPALAMALRKVSPIFSGMAAMFTIICVTGLFAMEPTFALLHLGEKWIAAGSEAARSQLIAAGEAVIAAGMWHSTGAYMGGILLQGSGVMISVIMLRSDDFRKVTAWSGLLGNALDLLQHMLHPFFPGLFGPVTAIMGLFYPVWFVMLGLDFWRLARKVENE